MVGGFASSSTGTHVYPEERRAWPVATHRASRALPNHPFARLLRGFAVSGDTGAIADPDARSSAE